MKQAPSEKKYKVIISGGGTGGHVFPAISIADALKEKINEIEILFVGALGRLEMEKVPAAGYKIIGLPVSGFRRKISFGVVIFLVRLINSMIKARKIVKNFKPDVVVGVGGYASGPVLRVASNMGIPTLIQEQNSYAGATNRILAGKAHKICVAYQEMEKYFPADKIILTGNPIRKNLFENDIRINEALLYFELDAGKKTVLILGGSLGAGTINNAISNNLELIGKQNQLQILWQTGKNYYDHVVSIAERFNLPNVKIFDFINRMDYAYAVADIIISRAGAGTISELCMAGKPCILVPSPNVAEDHQKKNAMALVNKSAAMMIEDREAPENLIDELIKLSADNDRINELSQNIKKMALPDSAEKIAMEVMKLIKN